MAGPEVSPEAPLVCIVLGAQPTLLSVPPVWILLTPPFMIFEGSDPLEGFLAVLAQEGLGSGVYHHVVLQFGLGIADFLAGPTGKLDCRGVMLFAVAEKGGGIPKILVAGSTVMCCLLQVFGLQVVPEPGA